MAAVGSLIARRTADAYRLDRAYELFSPPGDARNIQFVFQFSSRGRRARLPLVYNAPGEFRLAATRGSWAALFCFEGNPEKEKEAGDFSRLGVLEGRIFRMFENNSEIVYVLETL